MEAETEKAQVQGAPVHRKRILIGACLLLFVLVGLGLYLATRDHGVFFSQISVSDVNLSGLTFEQGCQKLEEESNAKLAEELSFRIPGEEDVITLSLKTLGLTLAQDQALDQAWAIGRQGNPLTRIIQRLQSHTEYEIPLNSSWDDKTLSSTLVNTFQKYTVSPRDASFVINEDNTMEIVPEQPGRMIDFAALAQRIKETNLNDNLPTFDVPVNSTFSPQVTQAQLEPLKITGLLVRFTTYFDPSQINRTENIRLAAQAIDKKLLAPDEIFSFNQTVGERTAEAGYKEALVIEENAFTPGLGGGICQVSSTLYNAVLTGQLQVIERHSHSLPITYVAPGRDATVSYPVLDLKFKNTSEGYLLIRSSVQGNSLTFELYGKG